MFSENRAVREIMWQNVVDSDRPQMTVIRRTRFACSITKAVDTFSEYVVLNASPLQQRFLERASTLHYTRIARLVGDVRVKVHPCTGTEAEYRPYGP